MVIEAINMSKVLVFLLGIFFLPFSYAQTLVFKHGQHSLSGHYLAATNNKPAKAVLLFVHGDGATPYDADGYYNIIWESLREQGYAILVGTNQMSVGPPVTG